MDEDSLVWQPFRLGDVELIGRVIRLPHGTGTLARGGFNDQWCAFHAQYAAAKVPMSVLEACSVHPSSPGHLRIWSRGDVAGVRPLVAAAEQHGMALIQQLWHAGHHAVPVDRGPAWSPSGVLSPTSTHPARTMQPSDIEEVVESFARAAQACAAAGMSGVELHAGHGYLFHQFLSIRTNLRQDGYGGSPEGRARLLHEVVEAIRTCVPPGFVVGVRVSMAASWEGERFDEDMLEVVKGLDRSGHVDYLSLSAGSHHERDEFLGGRLRPRGYMLEQARRFTAAVRTPTIGAGRIASVAAAEDALRGGDCDLVGMARAFIADPLILVKSRNGRAETVRPCISCNEGCIGGIQTGVVACTVNPLTPRPDPVEGVRRTGQHGQVHVLGGGPAGLGVAWRLAKAGATVRLYEASTRLGGQLKYAARTRAFEELEDYRRWLIRSVTRAGVEIELGRGELSWPPVGEGPAAVRVLATGGVEPTTPGSALAPEIHPPAMVRVATPGELWESPPERGQHLLVLDETGDYVTAALLSSLLDCGAQVSVVSRFSELLPRLRAYFQLGDYESLLGPRLRHWPRSFVAGWEGNAAVVRAASGDAGQTMVTEVDMVVPLMPRQSRGPGGAALQHGWHVVGEARGVTGLRLVTRDVERTSTQLLSGLLPDAASNVPDGSTEE